MKFKKIILVCVIASLLLISTKAIAEPVVISPDLPLEKQVELFTLVYGGDVELNKKVISCESNGKQTAVGDSGLSRGIAQFQKPTFDSLSKKFGEELNYNSSYDQLKLLVWSIANGYGSNWTAWRAIKNGGTYSFYSNQLKKHFTVTCR